MTATVKSEVYNEVFRESEVCKDEIISDARSACKGTLGEVMAYLYLNFEENLQSGSKNWDDFYTESLQAQYEKLKIKLGKIFVIFT